MSRIAETRAGGPEMLSARIVVPIASTVAATLVGLLPIVASAPLIPDFGFLFLIAWRVLRPEIWTARIALALGLVDDLLSGNPLGQSMALWTMTMLALDLSETVVVWRDYWMDWALAAVAILFYTAGGWFVAGLLGSRIPFTVMLPQIALSVLVFPLVARIVLALDRWRLAR